MKYELYIKDTNECILAYHPTTSGSLRYKVDTKTIAKRYFISKVKVEESEFDNKYYILSIII